MHTDAAGSYLDAVAPHLPPVLLDFHTHVWSGSTLSTVPPGETSKGKGGTCMVTTDEYPVERLLPAEMEKAAGFLRDLPSVFLDTSMVMDEMVLQIVFDTIGPSRVLFATDYPVAAMKGRRVRVQDHWVDVVQGDYPPSLTEMDLHGVFCGNGMSLLRGVRGGAALSKVESAWRRI